MSYLGIVITSVFAANALLSYGLGSVPGKRRDGQGQFASALALAGVNALASVFLWGVRTLALSPLGMPSLDIFFFALLAVPALKFVARAAVLHGKGILAQVGGESEDLIVGSLVFGVALISANSGFSLPESLAASASSGLGYWLATALLESLRERLELSDLPRPFRGGPAMLISAGLMALALMGIDAAFVKTMTG